MAEISRLVVERTWMLFVDGENFTKRGQEVLMGAGVAPEAGPFWRRDTFLWLPRRRAREAFFAPFTLGLAPQAPAGSRAYFYTSQEADEPEWSDTRLALRELGFEPRLFKRQRGKSKAVDVGLATEVLTLASEDRYETAVILAGDGDYVPLVEAVKRIGQYVVLGFFVESGLSPELRIAADEFVDLTKYLVDAWTEFKEHPPTANPGASH